MDPNNIETSGQPAEEEYGPKRWGRRARDIAAVIWPAFLVAGVATMVLFALVDPLILNDAVMPDVELGRMTGYAAGFFFFWIIAAGSSAISLFLTRTHRRTGPRSGSR